MTDLPKCRWCGGPPHPGLWCPLVKALTFMDEFPEVVQTVEFHDPQPVVFNPRDMIVGTGSPVVELKR